MTKNIHTSIDTDTWKLAVHNDISWSKALKLGIEALSGIDKDKKQLQEQKETFLAKIRYIDEKLEDMKKKEQESQEKNRKGMVREW